MWPWHCAVRGQPPPLAGSASCRLPLRKSGPSQPRRRCGRLSSSCHLVWPAGSLAWLQGMRRRTALGRQLPVALAGLAAPLQAACARQKRLGACCLGAQINCGNEAYSLTRCKQAEEAPKRYRDFIRTWREEPKALQVFAAGNAIPQPQCAAAAAKSATTMTTTTERQPVWVLA
jgi:hypothetical protein